MYRFASTQIRVITKLPNSEQSYKGKVKTRKYINRQNQSTTGKLWKEDIPFWFWCPIDEYVNFGENDSSQYVEDKLPNITNKKWKWNKRDKYVHMYPTLWPSVL